MRTARESIERTNRPHASSPSSPSTSSTSHALIFAVHSALLLLLLLSLRANELLLLLLLFCSAHVLLLLCLCADVAVDDRVDGERARAVEEEEEEDKGVQRGLLEVVRVARDVSERKALQACACEMEVDGAAHGEEERQSSRAGEEADREEDSAKEFRVVMKGCPQREVSGQETEVGLHDEIDEPLERLSAKVCRQDSALISVVNHENARHDTKGNNGHSMNPGDFLNRLEQLWANQLVQRCFFLRRICLHAESGGLHKAAASCLLE
mmetsp:Transcript_3577/g.6756  ORF Transcript_3577/g.6756 Transcript_3577/m.6756 type:complete len:267 (+) Transcript_3577:25-825(+)